MVHQGDTPFDGRATEIPLSRSPLTSVLAQVRFEPLTSLVASRARGDEYALAVSDLLPVLHRGESVDADLGSPDLFRSNAWRLSTAADQSWSVHLTGAFLTLETSAYTSRADFLRVWDRVWRPFCEIVRPPSTARVGIRYVNQLTAPEHVDDAANLFDSRVLGLGGVPLGERASLQHGISQALYATGEGHSLLVRAGRVPPGWVIDPGIPAHPETSWVLDLDAYTEGSGSADPSAVHDTLARGAEVAHGFFSWSITPAFITTFGGEDR